MSVDDFNEKSQQYQGFYSSGNGCGHKKYDFREILFPLEANRPDVIQWAMKRIRKRFVSPDNYFHDLKELNRKQESNGEPSTIDPRLTRSEGRESLMILSLLLFYNLELSTMTIRSDDIVFNSPTLLKLTKEGDHIHLSMSRTYRALRKLVKAGWVKVTRQYQKSKNLYCALASIKEVTPKFFIALKLGSSYEKNKHYKQKVLEKKQFKKSKKQMQMQRFDVYLPFRDTVFKKAGTKAVEVVTGEKIEIMRRKVILFCAEQSPAVDLDLIIGTVYKYPYEALKRIFQTYCLKKVHDPP